MVWVEKSRHEQNIWFISRLYIFIECVSQCQEFHNLISDDTIVRLLYIVFEEHTLDSSDEGFLCSVVCCSVLIVLSATMNRTDVYDDTLTGELCQVTIVQDGAKLIIRYMYVVEHVMHFNKIFILKRFLNGAV